MTATNRRHEADIDRVAAHNHKIALQHAIDDPEARPIASALNEISPDEPRGAAFDLRYLGEEGEGSGQQRDA